MVGFVWFALLFDFDDEDVLQVGVVYEGRISAEARVVLLYVDLELV